MKKQVVHADMSTELDKVVRACGKTFETGLNKGDLFVYYETFAALVCDEDEVKCADCEKEMQRRAA